MAHIALWSDPNFVGEQGVDMQILRRPNDLGSAISLTNNQQSYIDELTRSMRVAIRVQVTAAFNAALIRKNAAAEVCAYNLCTSISFAILFPTQLTHMQCDSRKQLYSICASGLIMLFC